MSTYDVDYPYAAYVPVWIVWRGHIPEQENTEGLSWWARQFRSRVVPVDMQACLFFI